MTTIKCTLTYLTLYLTGCPTPGYYGENCSIPCPMNCQERCCSITEGTCLSCKPENRGNECNQGRYLFVIMHRKIIDYLLFSVIWPCCVDYKRQNTVCCVDDIMQYSLVFERYATLKQMKLSNLWTRWSMWQNNLSLLRWLSSRLDMKYMWKKVNKNFRSLF